MQYHAIVWTRKSNAFRLCFFHFIINKKSESVRRRHCSGKPTQAPAEQESKDSLVLSAWLCPRQLEADLFVIEFCTTLLDLFEKEGNGSIAIWLKITLPLPVRILLNQVYWSCRQWSREYLDVNFGCEACYVGRACRSQSWWPHPASVPKYHVMCSTCPGHHNIKNIHAVICLFCFKCKYTILKCSCSIWGGLHLVSMVDVYVRNTVRRELLIAY